MDAIKRLIAIMNEKGIPIPAVRDKGIPSFTATMFLISFFICVIALAGKMANFFGGMNFNDCLTLYLASGSFYFGRKFQKMKDGSISAELKEEKKDDIQ